MKRLLIVRHGDTFLPDHQPRRIGARSDLPLVDRGEAQALDLAAWFTLHAILPDCAFAAPLQRTVRTAQIIVSNLPFQCPLENAAWLTEVDYGLDEGRPESEVINRVGADALAAWDRWGEPAPGWRVDRAYLIDSTLAGLKGLNSGTTLLVTSNGTARFLLLALGLDAGLPNLKLRTGAMGEIWVGEGSATLRRWDVRPCDRSAEVS